MGSYGRLARRALETEMPIMVQVFEPYLIIIRLLFQSLSQLWCVFLCLNVRACLFLGQGDRLLLNNGWWNFLQIQELIRGAKNALSLAQVWKCFSITRFFDLLCWWGKFQKTRKVKKVCIGFSMLPWRWWPYFFFLYGFLCCTRRIFSLFIAFGN